MFGRLDDWLRRWAGLAPHVGRALRRGVRAFDRGAYQAARADFETVVAYAPHLADGWINRGACRAQEGDHAGAIEDFSRAVQLAPQVVDGWANRGLSYIARGEFAAAHADLNQALLLAPDNNPALCNSVLCHRGIAALHLGWLERSVNDLDQVLARDPQVAMAYYFRGMARENLGQPDEALADLQTAARLAPGDGAVWRELGMLHYLRGELTTAGEMLSRAIAILSDDHLARNNRGAAAFLLGDYALAQADLTAVVAAQPVFASGLKNLAWLRATCPDGEYRQGAEAVALATQALTLVAWDQPQWFEVLAAAYAESGDLVQAVHWQQQAVGALDAGPHSPAQSRLSLYQSGRPFRHLPLGTAPLELVPGSRWLRGSPTRGPHSSSLGK
ncbi:MAG: tetratricopeptide repeat protein [Pirellulaceae bacterium]|nr:tetratricopeptide repeat protein [Pirellulaceae bacterium]